MNNGKIFNLRNVKSDLKFAVCLEFHLKWHLERVYDHRQQEKCEFYEMDGVMMILIFFFGAPYIRMMILKRLYIFSMCCKNGFWLLFLLLILGVVFFFRSLFFSSSEGHSNTKVSACLLVSQYPTFSKNPIIKNVLRNVIAQISGKI